MRWSSSSRPRIGGVVTSDGKLVPAHQKIDGGPSVLYDAVALLASAEARPLLAHDPAAKDFVTDAHAHCKFIAYAPAARPCWTPPVSPRLDDGYVALDGRRAISDFIQQCRSVRHWPRSMRTANEPKAGAVAS